MEISCDYSAGKMSFVAECRFTLKSISLTLNDPVLARNEVELSFKGRSVRFLYIQTKYDLFFYDNKTGYNELQILMKNNPQEVHSLLLKHRQSSGDMHKLLKSVYSHMCKTLSITGYDHLKHHNDSFILDREFNPIYESDSLLYPIAVDSLSDLSTLFANFNREYFNKVRKQQEEDRQRLEEDRKRREEARKQQEEDRQAALRENRRIAQQQREDLRMDPKFTSDAMKILPDIIRMEPFASHKGIVAFRRIEIDCHFIGEKDASCIRLYSSYNTRKAIYVYSSAGLGEEIRNLMERAKSETEQKVFFCVPDDIDLYARALAFLMPELHPLVGTDARPYPVMYLHEEERIKADYPHGVNIDIPQTLAMNDEAFDVFLAVRDEWEDPGIRQIVNTSRDCYERVMQVYEETRAVCDERSSNRKMNATLHKEREIKLSGIRGEQEVDYVLKWLGGNSLFVDDNTHDKFGNPCIKLKNSKFRDEAQEYDHIVIRENGVFIIETKNYGGKIVISPDGNWTHTNSKGETKGLRNPSQQVYRHEVLLKSFLPRDIPIISVICLSNPNLILEGQSSSKVPVFKSDLLAEYIVEYKSKVKIPLKKMREIKELIESYRSE